MQDHSKQLHTALAPCELCPRRCGANRAAGEKGYCEGGSEAKIFRFGPHHGEEPPISGSKGSGTVFFSRCTLRCLYCQNYPWSQEGKGETSSVKELAGVFAELQYRGCHNINLVSPTPWLPMIRAALNMANNDDDRIPVVYNTSGFERAGVLAEHEDLVDIYLTDLRYSNADTASLASSASTYVDAAHEALIEMWRQKGPLKIDADGIAESGTICRLLILPGHAQEAVANLEWLARNIGTDIAISLMAQYTPAHQAVKTTPWNRRITAAEYRHVTGALEKFGFSQGWTQDFEGPVDDALVGYKMPGDQSLT